MLWCGCVWGRWQRATNILHILLCVASRSPLDLSCCSLPQRHECRGQNGTQTPNTCTPRQRQRRRRTKIPKKVFGTTATLDLNGYRICIFLLTPTVFCGVGSIEVRILYVTHRNGNALLDVCVCFCVCACVCRSCRPWLHPEKWRKCQQTSVPFGWWIVAALTKNPVNVFHTEHITSSRRSGNTKPIMIVSEGHNLFWNVPHNLQYVTRSN